MDRENGLQLPKDRGEEQIGKETCEWRIETTRLPLSTAPAPRWPARKSVGIRRRSQGTL